MGSYILSLLGDTLFGTNTVLVMSISQLAYLPYYCEIATVNYANVVPSSGSFSDLQKTYNDLKTLSGKLVGDNVTLQSENNSLKSENNSLKSENVLLKSKNTELEAKNLKQKEDLLSTKTIQIRRDATKQKYLEIESRNNVLTEENYTLKSENGALKSENEALRSKQSASQYEHNQKQLEQLKFDKNSLEKIKSKQDIELKYLRDEINIRKIFEQEQKSEIESQKNEIQSMQENLLQEMESFLFCCPECSVKKYFFAELVQCDKNKDHVVCKKCFDKSENKTNRKCFKCDGKMNTMSIEDFDHTKLNNEYSKKFDLQFPFSLQYHRDINSLRRIHIHSDSRVELCF